MEDRLKQLKKSMDKTAFSKLNFTEKHRNEIRKKINEKEEKDADIFLAVMQLLAFEKTGFELGKLLRGRGILKFEDNEGSLYTLLHQLERAGCIKSSWNESDVKHYHVSNKGRKIVQKAEKENSITHLKLKELFGR